MKCIWMSSGFFFLNRELGGRSFINKSRSRMEQKVQKSHVCLPPPHMCLTSPGVVHVWQLIKPHQHRESLSSWSIVVSLCAGTVWNRSLWNHREVSFSTSKDLWALLVLSSRTTALDKPWSFNVSTFLPFSGRHRIEILPAAFSASLANVHPDFFGPLLAWQPSPVHTDVLVPYFVVALTSYLTELTSERDNVFCLAFSDGPVHGYLVSCSWAEHPCIGNVRQQVFLLLLDGQWWAGSCQGCLQPQCVCARTHAHMQTNIWEDRGMETVYGGNVRVLRACK